jgi:hypothetical protein
VSRFYGGPDGLRSRRRGVAARDLAPGRPRLRGADPGLSLARLAAAVREHQAVAGHPAVPARPADHELYRRLEAIERTYR